MGLDITAYELDAERLEGHHAQLAVDRDGYPKDDSVWWLRPQTIEYVKSNFNLDVGLEPGYYRVRDTLSFRAGSYGGYNAWREWLARAAGYASARDVWRDPRPGPFVELINFSDCEGVIGPATCIKLMNDFVEFADKVGNGDYRRVYDLFRRAFEMGARGGCVEFH